MVVSQCPQCQTELLEGAVSCPQCGAAIPAAAPVSFAPAFMGIALFVVVLLVCEWLEVLWPVALTGIALLGFIIFKYGKLAYVAPVAPTPKMEAEVPVGQLLEKVE